MVQSEMKTGTSIETRELLSGDVAKFRQMLNLFGRVFDEPHNYIDNQPDDGYLEALLGGEQFIGVIAETGETIVGGLAAYELKKFEQKRSEIYIYDLAVDKQHRRQGVATALIEKVKDIARARGVYVIFVQADQGDEPPTALYTKLGTREDVLHFDIVP